MSDDNIPKFTGFEGVTFWNNVRSLRNKKLKASDWTQSPDSPLSETKKTEWATYRQALRDVPADNSSASSQQEVIFPSEPS
jgi:hypothetical protein|tara:strand:+ start:816 stop:1058 length:243 start_codon:yes stop_codon:yes gene_type:complete